jgi:putative glutamine amidotransferase
VSSALPLIGISVGAGILSETNGAQLRVRSTYPISVDLAGGAPVMIPLRIETDALRAIYERLDGVIISGGGDMAPSTYGADQSVFTDEIDTNRDQIELQLIRWALEDDKPLLGICRGHQVLNVALGGTLIQDIREEIQGSLRHDSPTDDWFTRFAHDIQVARGSKLYESLGLTEERLPVNSLHHQAIGEVAPSLCVVARATDGVIEGLEHPERRYVVSVQWHPEALTTREIPQRNLFEAFVKAASR